MGSQRRLKLLPKEALIKTGPVDHADWNYRPFLGWIQRLRFKLAASLVRKQQPIQKLLKVGYGSGIFMPELSQYCDELYGLDIHPMPEQVTEILEQYGVRAHLTSASAVSMPFPDQMFDGITVVSALEFVEPLEAACQEFKRVLKPGGFLVVITPGHSPVVDLGLKILTGESARKDFGDRRDAIIPTLLKHFKVEKQLLVPPLGNWFGICLYTALLLRPLPDALSGGSLKTEPYRKPQSQQL
jgi:SAM-dependent methyltransferase